jgi:hypothetical protein
MKVNNKYREVLENILTNFPGGLGLYPEIYSQVTDVLKEPLRNCDVGTAREQKERFDNYCESIECNKCPAYFDKSIDCGIWWSQMPYEEVKQ